MRTKQRRTALFLYLPHAFRHSPEAQLDGDPFGTRYAKAEVGAREIVCILKGSGEGPLPSVGEELRKRTIHKDLELDSTIGPAQLQCGAFRGCLTALLKGDIEGAVDSTTEPDGHAAMSSYIGVIVTVSQRDGETCGSIPPLKAHVCLDVCMEPRISRQRHGFVLSGFNRGIQSVSVAHV